MKAKLLPFTLLLHSIFSTAQCPNIASYWDIDSATTISADCSNSGVIRIGYNNANAFGVSFTSGNFINNGNANFTIHNNAYVLIGNQSFTNFGFIKNFSTNSYYSIEINSVFNNKPNSTFQINSLQARALLDTNGVLNNEGSFSNIGFMNILGTINNMNGGEFLAGNFSTFSGYGLFHNMNGGQFNAAVYSIVDIKLLNNGSVENHGTMRVSSNSSNSNSIINSNTFEVHNGSVFTNTGVFTNNSILNNINSSIINNQNIITGDNNGVLNNINTTFNNLYGATFDLKLANNLGVVNNGGLLKLKNNSSNSGTINGQASGTIEVYNNSTFTNTGTIYSYGTVVVNSGSIFINSNIFNRYQPGSNTFVNNGVFINNHSFTDEDGSNTFNNGIWSGNNIAHNGSFINNGILSPGSQVGTYLFNNNYTHNSTATLQVDIESATTNDLVVSQNQIFINGGTLNVEFINGFTPSAGEQYTIMSASNGISGTFNSINFPATYAPYMSVTYSNNDVVVNVSNTLSVEEFTFEKFIVFPNPAKNYFELKLLDNTAIESLEIYDNNGKLAKKFNNYIKIYDIQDLLQGNYSIIIKTNNQIYKTKLIK